MYTIETHSTELGIYADAHNPIFDIHVSTPDYYTSELEAAAAALSLLIAQTQIMASISAPCPE